MSDGDSRSTTSVNTSKKRSAEEPIDDLNNFVTNEIPSANMMESLESVIKELSNNIRILNNNFERLLVHKSAEQHMCQPLTTSIDIDSPMDRNISSGSKTELYQSVTASTVQPMTQAFLTNQLNKRKMIFWRSLRNKNMALLLEEQLTVHRIPKKFVPAYNDVHNAQLMDIIIGQCVSNVQYEIQKLKLFADGQISKLKEIDEHVEKCIETLQIEHQRDHFTKMWKSLVLSEEKKSRDLWRKKCEFLTSDKHMLQTDEISFFMQRHNNVLLKAGSRDTKVDQANVASQPDSRIRNGSFKPEAQFYSTRNPPTSRFHSVDQSRTVYPSNKYNSHSNNNLQITTTDRQQNYRPRIVNYAKAACPNFKDSTHFPPVNRSYTGDQHTFNRQTSNGLNFYRRNPTTRFK